MPRGSRVTAAVGGDFGAPRRLIANKYIASMALNCSTPRSERSDGSSGTCLQGVGAHAAVVRLSPGPATVMRNGTTGACAPAIFDVSFAAHTDAFTTFSRHAWPPLNAPLAVGSRRQPRSKREDFE